MGIEEKSSNLKAEYLVVDTTAFIEHANLQNIGQNIITCQNVVDEITSKRQLRRLVVLPYELQIKDVFPENVAFVTEFSKKTGDYPSLSATDIKVMALVYQLEKQHVGNQHLNSAPKMCPTVTSRPPSVPTENLAGFYKGESDMLHSELLAGMEENSSEKELDQVSACTGTLDPLEEKFAELKCNVDLDIDSDNNILVPVEDNTSSSEEDDYEDNDDDDGWITPSNIKQVKNKMDTELVEDKAVTVACITTDFAMQFSLPTPKGGKHANNPILVDRQPMPDQRPTRLAKTRNNPLDPDYIAGFSPFIMRDVNSKSAMLGIRGNNKEVKHWMRRNPNEVSKTSKKKK